MPSKHLTQQLPGGPFLPRFPPRFGFGFGFLGSGGKSSRSSRIPSRYLSTSPMDKAPALFLPLASAEEIADKTSWVNTSHKWDQSWQDHLCQRLGEAITAWALVETELFALYATAVRAQESRSVGMAWEVVQSPKALIDMTNAAMNGVERVTVNMEAWSKLYIRCGKKLSRRNLAAHGCIFYDHHAAKPDEKLFIASAKYASPIGDRLYASELIDMRNVFQRLSEDLTRFRATTFA